MCIFALCLFFQANSAEIKFSTPIINIHFFQVDKVEMSRYVEFRVTVKWQSDKPDTFNYLPTVNEILDKYTCEMDEDFTVLAKYTENDDEKETVVRLRNHIFLAVQSNNLILFLPDETLDIKVLISLWDCNVIDGTSI